MMPSKNQKQNKKLFVINAPGEYEVGGLFVYGISAPPDAREGHERGLTTLYRFEIGDLSVETFADIWARRPVATVGPECRIMCRGHVANTELERIFAKREHTAFV